MSLRTETLLNHAGLLEEFISDELETRKRCYIPNPTREECILLGTAELALVAAQELRAELQQEEDTFAAGSVEWAGRRA